MPRDRSAALLAGRSRFVATLPLSMVRGIQGQSVLAGYGARVSDLDPWPFRPDVPKHVQIAEVLRGRILAGELAPRMPVPSEPGIAQEFGVARDTARKAVRLLRDEGYVRTVAGMGSFVRDREDWPESS